VLDKAAKKIYDRAWRAVNKERLRVYFKTLREKDPDRVRKYNRDYHHLKKYGLSPAAFEAKLEAQGNRCAACGSSDPGHKNGWQVDHNHYTLAVRGILCCPCNIAVGFVEDADRVTILRAYLEAYS
jgi:hypothetical protein